MSNTSGESSMFSDDEITEMARTVEPHDFDRIAPPAQVWNNVLAELEVEIASAEADARRQPRRWLSSTRLLSIAAATLVMVGVAVAVVSYRSNNATPATDVVMMTNEGLQVTTSETATAQILCDDDQCFVEVDLTALPESGANDLELWVINGDVTDMHSLGNVNTSVGRFDLPVGVTAADFPIVDISVEPNDGDPTHSGQSVLRGVFS